MPKIGIVPRQQQQIPWCLFDDPSTWVTGAYGIFNLVNGKVYVGGAYKCFDDRERTHLWELRTGRHWNGHLLNSWNKYGEGSFHFKILERCRPDKETIRACEQRWIDAFDATNRDLGYNICPRAGTTLGAKLPPLTDEHKESNRQWGLENNTTSEAKERSSAASRRRWSQPGAKEAHLKMMAEQWADPQRKADMSKLMSEIWDDVAYRETMSQKRREQWEDPETRERTIAGMLATAATPEEKARKSEAMRNSWQDPAYVEKVLAARSTPEVLAKISAARKATWADPAYRERVAASYTEERREQMSQRMLAAHSRPETKEKIKATNNAKFYAKAAPWVEMIVTRYVAGDPVITLSRETGLTFDNVVRVLKEAGVRRRTRAEHVAMHRDEIAERARNFWARPGFKEVMSDKIKAGMAAAAGRFA